MSNHDIPTETPPPSKEDRSITDPVHPTNAQTEPWITRLSRIIEKRSWIKEILIQIVSGVLLILVTTVIGNFVFPSTAIWYFLDELIWSICVALVILALLMFSKANKPQYRITWLVIALFMPFSAFGAISLIANNVCKPDDVRFVIKNENDPNAQWVSYPADSIVNNVQRSEYYIIRASLASNPDDQTHGAYDCHWEEGANDGKLRTLINNSCDVRYLIGADDTAELLTVTLIRPQCSLNLTAVIQLWPEDQ